MKQVLVLFVAALAATGFAADPANTAPPTGTSSSETAPSITTTLPAAPKDSGITGFLDIRPTLDMSTKDTSRLETSVGVGYKFSKDLSVTLEQPFWHNISTPNPLFNGPLETQAREGHVRFTVKNVLPATGAFSFAYEFRAYYPSRTTWRDNGMVTAVRNIFNVTAKISPIFTITFAEQLNYHIYSQAFGPNGANPSFHNRVVIAPELSLLGGKLTAGLPIFFDAIRNREGNPALGPKALLGGNADSWYTTIWINPEIMYNVTKELQLGVSYVSGDLTTPDFSKFTIGDGLGSGAPQLALRMTL